MNGRVSAVVILTVLLLAFHQPVHGDAQEKDMVLVVLNNGGKIKGVVADHMESGVVIDVGYGTVSISFTDIKRIDPLSGEKKYEAIRQWQEHVQAVERNRRLRNRKLEEHQARIKKNLEEKAELAERSRKEEEHGIKFEDEDNILVEVVLNGELAEKMVIDTGATTVLVPLSVVEELSDIGDLPEKKVTTKLADGTEREGTPITLRSVEVEGLKVENVEAVAMEMPERRGLLGMSFLKNFHLRIDSEAKELILKEK